MYTIESKSVLARLLSKENITVVHGEYHTAFFDVQKRVLGLPVWKDKGKDVYDLLVGHEVGHALETPAEGWHESTVELGVPRGYVNVIEDIRIEKKVQRRYPGLVGSFTRGYQRLFDDNLFETHGNDLNSYNLIDRINLKAKLRTLVDIKFSDEEKPLVQRAFAVETWEDVLASCLELMEYMKEKQDEQQDETDNIDASASANNSDSDMDMPGQAGSEQSDDSDDETTDDPMGMGGDSDNEVGGSQGGDQKPEEQVEQNSPKVDDAPASLTDDAFRNNQSDIIEEYQGDRIFTAPTKRQFEKVIVPYADVLEARKNVWVSDRNEEYYEQFLKENKSVVNQMVREFEMRKAAFQYSRAKTAKTGSLDTRKLHSYKFNEDLFSRVTQLADAKSHGMIMYVDFSGSMYSVLGKVLKQVILLAHFCKKINVPFEIYAFNDLQCHETGEKYQMDQVTLARFGLVTLLTSDMGKAEFSTACQYLYLRDYFSNMYSKVEGLGCTPLCETIMAAHYMVPKFQKKHRVEKVATVFLTDGEASGMTTGRDQDYADYTVDRVSSGKLVNFDGFKFSPKYSDRPDQVLLNNLRHKTGAITVSFHLCTNQNDARSFMLRRGKTDSEKVLKDWRREGSAEVFGLNGFDASYIIKAHWKNLSARDDDFEVDTNASKAEIKRAFSKFSKGKKGKRSIMTNFARLVA